MPCHAKHLVPGSASMFTSPCFKKCCVSRLALVLHALMEDNKKNKRLRKKLYGLMRQERQNISQTVMAARSMQQETRPCLHVLLHPPLRAR